MKSRKSAAAGSVKCEAGDATTLAERCMFETVSEYGDDRDWSCEVGFAEHRESFEADDVARAVSCDHLGSPDVIRGIVLLGVASFQTPTVVSVSLQ